MIDQIEFNVVQSVNFVEEATKDTAQAVKYQTSARRVSGNKMHSMLCVCKIACLLNVDL